MSPRVPVVLRSSDLSPEEDLANRRFLDLQLLRVELVLEVMIRRLDSEDEGYDAEAELRGRIERVEQDILVMVGERESGEIQLPMLDLLELYELSEAEREIFVFCLAPHLDARLRRSFARYNDNVLLDYPDIQFCTVLVTRGRPEAMATRRLLDEDSTLLRDKLLELRPTKDFGADTVLRWEVRPPERLVDFVLGRTSLERSLQAYCELETPEVGLDQLVLPEETMSAVTALVERYDDFRERMAARVEGQGGGLGGAMVLQFSGPPGTGKTLCARAAATHMGSPLLRVNGGKLNLDDVTLERVLDNLFFEAGLHDAVICFESAESLFSQRNARLPMLYEQFERYHGLVILNAADPKQLDGTLERWVVYQVDFELPTPELRERIWALHLPEDVSLGEDLDLPILANQYDISGFQIRNAVFVATNRALASDPDAPVLTQKLLGAAAQAQLRASMEDYSVKSRATLTLDDIVLPEKELELVKEVLNAARVRPFVMNRWGFNKRLVTGKGIVCMFAGEPGTGKTLCAEILAATLSLSLYQVSIPRVMSKYVGETEKNIEKIFASARANQSILLFDEADALFTSRVKVESSVDRFANMEVNLLLQEIERFEGIILLTTNMDKNIDRAFQRRINFRINFPFPKPQYRCDIWRKLVPEECPLAEEVDFDVLGESFELSGGYIKNAVVRAAYRAYGQERAISYEDLLFAAEQECKAAGRIFRRPESLSP
jgi:SpoVK/Ycf46/Vps4 family AAA+-type ATPase